MQSLRRQNHLFWRAGFGPTPDMLFQSTPFEPGKYVQAIFVASKKSPVPLRVAQNVFDGLGNGISEIVRMQPNQRADSSAAMIAQRREIQQKNRQAIRSLNLEWMREMTDSPAQLREKMALFWHGHFACRNLNSYYQQQLLEVIREHALGNFGELLTAVSKSAAMLQFLNNQQNRKQRPNENFAREVMELFTLGRGNYTEQDVKEAARAFTGWGFNLDGSFVFRAFQHDTGSKTILGKTGKFGGEDVLSMLLEHRQTSRFICHKLYRFFVNDNPNDAHIDELSKQFYQSGYDIGALVKHLLTRDWFYAAENTGNHIKSPVEMIVGLRRQLPMIITNEDALLLLQRALGQILFYPPNVAGWPGGKSWIDSSTLMLRLRLPQLLAASESFDLHTKSDDDTEMGRMQGMPNAGMGNRFAIKTQIDWPQIYKAYAQYDPVQHRETIVQSVLQTNHHPPLALIESFTGKDAGLKRVLLMLMSLPEYQLC